MWDSKLQRHSELSLARQIYQILCNQMTEGLLKSGDALSSTRELAKSLGVSRNTVYEAYEMLSAEGYTVTRPGAPTRVADGLCLENTMPVMSKNKKPLQAFSRYIADFRTGKPDLRRFPRQTWLQLEHKAAEELPAEKWGYTGPEGLAVLRDEIAAWLLRSRGIIVNPQDIFITAGATQALYVLAELLSGEGQEILVEDPCHRGMLQVLTQKNFKICPVPVDEQGMQTGKLESSSASAVYVTPSHQFPLGGILPAGRRTELIRFARAKDIYIIEDDYDSEFRYIGSPVAPLWAMDRQRVIYVGTFSKILFPALRIGYCILPRQLHRRWRYLRTHTDVQNPPFEQAVLARYLSTRRLDRHIQQMRRLYGQRRQILLAQMTEIFGQTWSVWGDAAGLHLALAFPGKCFDQQFLRGCQAAGVLVTPAEYHSITKGLHMDKLILGYGHLEPAEINKGLRLLHKVFKRVFS
ncbi:MAG: PLP-dependent aminotransferase family protein [Pelosinus sp.]|nr:PLP-dependent aminotransferase family protein [Pelosinus sp.]